MESFEMVDHSLSQQQSGQQSPKSVVSALLTVRFM